MGYVAIGAFLVLSLPSFAQDAVSCLDYWADRCAGLTPRADAAPVHPVAPDR